MSELIPVFTGGSAKLGETKYGFMLKHRKASLYLPALWQGTRTGFDGIWEGEGSSRNIDDAFNFGRHVDGFI